MYRIVKCEDYNNLREIVNTWFEVQVFRSAWWSLGFKLWFTEKQCVWMDHYTPIQFSSEEKAIEYINRSLQKEYKNTVVRTPIRLL